MARKICDVKKELQLKEKSLVKTQKAFDEIDKECKRLAKAKDRDGFDKKDKERKNMQKALDSLEENIVKFKKVIVDLENGVEEFGKAREKYMTWFGKAKKELDSLLKICEDGAVDADKFGNAVEKAIDNGDVTAAKKALEGALEAAQEAKQAAKAVDKLVEGWGNNEWREQRNLAPSQFDVDNADCKKFDSITQEVYATFKVGDDARNDAKEFADKANTDAEEAKELVEAGGKSADYYRSILDKANSNLQTRIKSYDTTLGGSWGRMLVQNGERLKSEITLVQKDRSPTGIARAAKIVEQASSALPKALASTRKQVKMANDMVNKESSKIPKEFQRAVSAPLNTLRMALMQMVTKQRTVEKGYPEAMKVLKQLEDAIAG